MEDKTPSEKQELVKEVVGFDYWKIWTTFKELTFRPGQTVAAYCDGDRKKFVSPVAYFLLAYGINYFATKLSGIADYTVGSYTGKGDAFSDTTRTEETTEQLLGLLFSGQSNSSNAEHMRTVLASSLEFITSKEGLLLATFPVIMVMQWLFFKRFRKPFLQHLYFLLFVPAQINLLTLPLLVPFFFAPTYFWFMAVTVSTTVASLCIYLYAELKFYPRITLGNIVVRTLGQLAAGFIPFLIWFFVVMLATLFIVSKLSP